MNCSKKSILSIFELNFRFLIMWFYVLMSNLEKLRIPDNSFEYPVYKLFIFKCRCEILLMYSITLLKLIFDNSPLKV